MENKTYNGWANYPTWRINLEVWDGYETDYPLTGEEVEEMTWEIINPSGDNSLLANYAYQFLMDVDWEEIANHINEMNEVEAKED